MVSAKAFPANLTRWGDPRGENRDSPLSGCQAKAPLLRSIEIGKEFSRFLAGTPVSARESMFKYLNSTNFGDTG